MNCLLKSYAASANDSSANLQGTMVKPGLIAKRPTLASVQSSLSQEHPAFYTSMPSTSFGIPSQATAVWSLPFHPTLGP